MDNPQNIVLNCTAFDGITMVATGTIDNVACQVKEHLGHKEHAQILVFDDSNAQLIELDLRGPVADVLSKIQCSSHLSSQAVDAEVRSSGPGRPKLGVIAREVTLLPRHWQWLNDQPGGCSVALRKLVDAARLANSDKDCLRQAQEATYRFMSAMAGNEPHFEEATRALFAGNQDRFEELLAGWPADVAGYTGKLAAPCFVNASKAS